MWSREAFFTKGVLLKRGFTCTSRNEPRKEFPARTSALSRRTWGCSRDAEGTKVGARLKNGYTTLNREDLLALKQKGDKNASRFWRVINYFAKSEPTEEELTQAKRDVDQCIGNKVLRVTDSEIDSDAAEQQIDNVSISFDSLRPDDTSNLQLVMRKTGSGEEMFIGFNDGSMGVLRKTGSDPGVPLEFTTAGKKHLLSRGTGLFVGSFRVEGDSFKPKMTWEASDNSYLRIDGDDNKFGCSPSNANKNKMIIWMNSYEAGTISGFDYDVAGLPTGDNCVVDFIHGAQITGPLFAGVSGLGAQLVVWNPEFLVPQLNPLMTGDAVNYAPGSYTLTKSGDTVEFVSFEYVSKAFTQTTRKGTYLGGTLDKQKFGPGVYTGYVFSEAGDVNEVTTEKRHVREQRVFRRLARVVERRERAVHRAAFLPRGPVVHRRVGQGRRGQKRASARRKRAGSGPSCRRVSLAGRSKTGR